MSEPFGLDDSGGQPPRKQELDLSLGTLWENIVRLWNALWKQSLLIKRRGETVIQLPLVVAIVLGLLFPYAALAVLVVGLIVGYSLTVVKR